MTRNEYRTKCAKALMDGAAKTGLVSFQTDHATSWVAIFMGALDALNGIALVIPVEVDGYEGDGGWQDLTNPPEKKRD